jgi:sugar lactone lactonase YvrE
MKRARLTGTLEALAPLVIAGLIIAGCGEEARQAARPEPAKVAIPPRLSVGELAKVAGGGAQRGDGGPAASAGLCGPSGFALDAAGALYIADAAYECGGPGGKTLRKVARDGTITTVVGTGLPGSDGDGGPATDARLSFPAAVAVHDDGGLYVSDTDAFRIRRIDAQGTITTFAGTGEKGRSGDGGPAQDARLTEPGGLAFDTRGNLYVADGVAVRRIDRSGTITTVARLGAVDVALDRRGNLYVTDFEGGRLRKVDGDGTIRTVASLVGPAGVAVDRRGNVLVSEYDAARIRKIDARGRIRTIAGGGDAIADAGRARDALLPGLWGLAVDDSGIVYFGDVSKGLVYAARYE